MTSAEVGGVMAKQWFKHGAGSSGLETGFW
jgi:hypothetical protein